MPQPDWHCLMAFYLATSEAVKLWWVVVATPPFEQVIVSGSPPEILITDRTKIIVEAICLDGIELLGIFSVSAALLGVADECIENANPLRVW